MCKNLFRIVAGFLLLIILAACVVKPPVPEASSLWVEVVLTGGSGKTSVESPVELRPEKNGYTAVLHWSSSNYDYMLVDGSKYLPVNTEGNSVFEIPIPSTECTIAVQADTTAMSVPHLIDYTLTFGSALPTVFSTAVEEPSTVGEIPGVTVIGRMDLDFAEMFTVDYLEGGQSLIVIGNDRYLLVGENETVPEALPADITVLQQPLENIYLVSSSAMDMFAACDAMDSLGFSALRQSDWYIDEAASAMEDGTLVYAGKYSAPDYELLKAGNCGLAIENMMISHSPKVVEELRALGIPVLIERSSYEPTPQGRMEWIKLYGLLTGHSAEAKTAFDEQIRAFDRLNELAPSGKSAAVFYVTTSGAVSVRNASDYLPKMIELAGGKYVFADLGTASSSATTTIQPEEFYARAKGADVLLYNSTIAGELASIDDLLALSPLFADMKAVKDGQVYCLSKNLYQSSMELGSFTLELARVLNGDEMECSYIYALK